MLVIHLVLIHNLN